MCPSCRRLSSPLETQPGRGLWVPSFGLPVFLAPLFLLLSGWDQGDSMCSLFFNISFLAGRFPATFRGGSGRTLGRVDSLSSGGEM